MPTREYAQLYGRRWRKARRQWLADHALCSDYFGLHGGRPVPATEVDHIRPHRGDWTLFWDERNWQSLCNPCHSRKTMTEEHENPRPHVTVLFGPAEAGRRALVPRWSDQDVVLCESMLAQAIKFGMKLLHDAPSIEMAGSDSTEEARRLATAAFDAAVERLLRLSQPIKAFVITDRPIVLDRLAAVTVALIRTENHDA